MSSGVVAGTRQIGTGLEGCADLEEMAAGHVVDALFSTFFQMPVTVAKYRGIGPGGHHLAEEQVVGLLDVRLADQPAFEPLRVSVLLSSTATT